MNVDWHLTGAACLWACHFLLGQVSKNACHAAIQHLNADSIITSHYDAVWGAWDEFKNASILQLLHLHPADGGQGIANNKDHAISILLMGHSELYPNRVVVNRETRTLKVEYYAGSGQGKRMLKRAMKNRILLRVFLSPKAHERAAFSGDAAAILFLPLMTVENKQKDRRGRAFFVLLDRLSEQEFVHCRNSTPE